MDRRYAIGNFICELRQEKGFTQKELGDLLGVTNKAVSKWETGAALPRLDTLRQLADILGCTQEELFLGHRIDRADPEEDKPSVTEGYISVVQRCNACRHEPKGKSTLPLLFGKEEYCKKCGAKLRLKPVCTAVLIALLLSLCAAVWFGSITISDRLLICNFYAKFFPNAEEAEFHRLLHEHFPKLETIGTIAIAAIYLACLLAAFIVFYVIVRLLTKKMEYKIVGYPHAEDGKIVL